MSATIMMAIAGSALYLAYRNKRKRKPPASQVYKSHGVLLHKVNGKFVLLDFSSLPIEQYKGPYVIGELQRLRDDCHLEMFPNVERYGTREQEQASFRCAYIRWLKKNFPMATWPPSDPETFLIRWNPYDSASGTVEERTWKQSFDDPDDVWDPNN